MTVSVLIADDQALVRTGFRMILETDPGIRVVAEAGDGSQAVDAGKRTRPDIALMDIRMPVMDGLEATRRLLASPNPPRVLMLTTFDLDEYVFDALRSGASGFLLKDTPPEELLAAIRIIAEGESLLAPSVTRRLIAEFASRPPAAADPGDKLGVLTEREREVLVAVAQGSSNAELAGDLHMSVATAKTHVSRILAKLGARDRTQLVVIAYQTGLVRAR